ncbi:hypothetical protein F2Q70_00032684 [Brassica cretica]|uniref:Zinc finger GRF-type domain-containing protein n=1 Tax=Brassica cretica TaxID=69181 RepID=A0A8S9FK13_BRACR|nr:hypothetical protein F2Q70_00032684 [Brassica cretica]
MKVGSPCFFGFLCGSSNRRPGVRHSTFESLRLGLSSQSIASGFLRFWDSLNFKKDREFVGITVLFLDEKLMDPNEERRSMKALKAHFDTLHFVTDSMQGIQERCACGQRLVRERAPAEVFDCLPGKRFFTCKEYKDDGMHYRQPWVRAVEEELGFMKMRLEKCEEYKSLVVKLEVENQELKNSPFQAEQQMEANFSGSSSTSRQNQKIDVGGRLIKGILQRSETA